jgi:hypothetical protein
MSAFKYLLCLTLLFFLSCSAEKPAGVEGQKPSTPADNSISGTSQHGAAQGTSGSYSLEIVPANVTRNSTIHLIARGFRPSDAKIEWLVNGIPVTGATGDNFNTSETKKKDTVQARAEVQGKELLSNIVEIQNAPPEIKNVRLLPEVSKSGNFLSVESSGSDIDGDGVTISYEWTKNGEPAGDGKQIANPLKRGDKVDVKITPFDGEDYGRSVILHREIVNLPPVIIENNKHRFDGNTYTSQVEATDPDGDPLTYSLKSGPPGMTIDSASGLIKWNVPANFAGKAPFVVSVADGHGGEASQGLTLNIKPGQKK